MKVTKASMFLASCFFASSSVLLAPPSSYLQIKPDEIHKNFSTSEISAAMITMPTGWVDRSRKKGIEALAEQANKDIYGAMSLGNPNIDTEQSLIDLYEQRYEEIVGSYQI